MMVHGVWSQYLAEAPHEPNPPQRVGNILQGRYYFMGAVWDGKQLWALCKGSRWEQVAMILILGINDV